MANVPVSGGVEEELSREEVSVESAAGPWVVNSWASAAPLPAARSPTAALVTKLRISRRRGRDTVEQCNISLPDAPHRMGRLGRAPCIYTASCLSPFHLFTPILHRVVSLLSSLQMHKTSCMCGWISGLGKTRYITGGRLDHERLWKGARSGLVTRVLSRSCGVSRPDTNRVQLPVPTSVNRLGGMNQCAVHRWLRSASQDCLGLSSQANGQPSESWH